MVRFGDHQPDFAAAIIDPASAMPSRPAPADQRSEILHTLLRPQHHQLPAKNIASALDTLEAPYLPLVVQEAAGLPLDPLASRTDSRTLPRPRFLRLCRRREARRCQPTADQRRLDQGCRRLAMSSVSLSPAAAGRRFVARRIHPDGARGHRVYSLAALAISTDRVGSRAPGAPRCSPGGL